MNPNRKLQELIWQAFSFQVPRILTQLERDPASPCYGSFDRDFWHYKMRDFSSIILQQGALVLECLRTLNIPGNELYENALVEEWVDAAVDFWASQQLPSGAFNEYYPFEAGYPPTAFSLYAIGLIYEKRGFPAPADNHLAAAQKAIHWLLANREQQALNQEAAGLAAIALCSRMPGIVVDAASYQARLELFFGSQSVEGWFPEYGGPDIGYLSVTIDCLWDYYRCTGDQRGLDAALKAAHFVAAMVSVSGHTPVMINSRNTDYIVPYGLSCLGAGDEISAGVVQALYGSIARPDHFFHSTDDRYACHYIHQSTVRSLAEIPAMKAAASPMRFEQYFYDCGIFVRHLPKCESAYVAGKKGGVVYLYGAQGLREADFGYRARLGRDSVAVTHWQDQSYSVDFRHGEGVATIVVKGEMSAHRFLIPTPLQHIVLRVLSFTFGNKLIPLLKRALIFRAGKAALSFKRTIEISSGSIAVRDEFSGADCAKSIHPAPQYSLRHVASASRFSPEELLPVQDAVSDRSGGKDALYFRKVMSSSGP